MSGLEFAPVGILVVVLGNLLSDVITAIWVIHRTKKQREEYVRMMSQLAPSDNAEVPSSEAGYR